MPRRGIARAWLTSCDAFSCNVMRCTRSAARCCGDSERSLYGGVAGSCALAPAAVRASTVKAAANRRLPGAITAAGGELPDPGARDFDSATMSADIVGLIYERQIVERRLPSADTRRN